MTQLYPNVVGLDAAILMAGECWVASGHVAGFHDWMVDHKGSKRRYRVDVLVEKCAEGWRAAGRVEEAKGLLDRLHGLLERGDGAGLTGLLEEAGIGCPEGGKGGWTVARRFNLMLSTEVGSVAGHTQRIYLRPETAQGIFVNFLNIQRSGRLALPFGVAQVGKAFRNEIVARQFIFRMREFEQMEMQFFVRPGEEGRWFEYWIAERMAWYGVLGISEGSLEVVPHGQLAHYAKAAVDVTYGFPFGRKEVEGIHARGDFDLRSHGALSGKRLAYFDPVVGEHYVPCVVETSVGCDRLVLMLLSEAFTEVEGRTWLRLPAPLAPMGVAVLPLVKKTPLLERAQGLRRALVPFFSVAYEERGSIGKRYVRQDLLGTPFCVTVDFDTLTDGAVTVRERVSMEQVRVSMAELRGYLAERFR